MSDIAPYTGTVADEMVMRAVRAQYRQRPAEPMMEAHSITWRSARASIRHLNYLSPMINAIIAAPGALSSNEERLTALNFLSTHVRVLSANATEAAGVGQPQRITERVELEDTLSHVVADLWVKAAGADPMQRIADFGHFVQDAFSNPKFIEAESVHTDALMSAINYRRVDSPETAESRIRLSLHQAAFRLYEAVVDTRLCGTKSAKPFLYGQPSASALTAQLNASFQGAFARTVREVHFVEALNNDQRTTMMQAWMRVSSQIFASHYVARTIQEREWILEGMSVNADEMNRRIRSVQAKLPEVLAQCAEIAHSELSELITIADFRVAAEGLGQHRLADPAPEPAPASSTATSHP
ncbi:MAG: hypothetical protein KGL39_21545 [Patescibacteria group bacterium]|nr:hypothetical protein [Patescibacteria group bacterium]